MPELSTPEAEPQHDESESSGSSEALQQMAAQQASDAQASAAQAPVAQQEPLQEMIDRQRSAFEGREATPGAQEKAGNSIWSYCRDKVRKPMRTLLLAGIIAANPVVAGTTFVGKKALDVSVGRVPVVRKIYETPINIVKKGVDLTADAATAVVTSPALIPDTAVNVGQGLAGINTREAKGFIGKTWEHVSHGVGGTLKFAMESGKWAGEKSLNLVKGTLEKSVKVLTGLVTVPFTAVNGALKTSLSGMKGAAAGGVTGAVSSVATVALAGLGVWTMALGNPAATYLPWLQGIIKAAWTAVM